MKQQSGSDAGTVDLDDTYFGVQPNVPVMHQVVTAQLAARRSGTQSTKTRSEVSGGGAKPYRQKGTGNARQGSTRAPHFSGGGIALGPKPRKYNQRTPKKMIRQALLGALSDRARTDRLHVVKSLGLGDAPSTKTAAAFIEKTAPGPKVLVVIGRADEVGQKSVRNIPGVHALHPDQLNAYDVLESDDIIFTQDAFEQFVQGPVSAGEEAAK